MQRVWILAGVAALACALPAQQDPKPADAGGKQSPQQRLASIQQEMQDAMTKWRAEARKRQAEAKKAQASGGTVPAMAMRPNLDAFYAKLEDAANDYAGTEDAVPFLIELVRRSVQSDRGKRALETLVDSHVDSPQLAKIGSLMPFLPRVVDEKKAAEILAKVEAGSGDPDVQAWVLLAKHQKTIEKADVDSEAYVTAKTQLLAAAEKATDKQLAQRITGSIDEREKFGVGVTAPDIVGVDLDGTKFKLSDYKGKVIFLDFWGDW